MNKTVLMLMLLASAQASAAANMWTAPACRVRRNTGYKTKMAVSCC